MKTGKCAATLAVPKEVLQAFFDLKECDGANESARKVSLTIARRVAYAVADYWLTFLSAALVIAMKAFGYEFHVIFLALWAFDVIVANTFVAIWQKTGNDLTLGADYRRAIDVVYRKSKLIGTLTLLGVIVKASFWDGPEHIVIFFQKEIMTEARMALALLVLTALQAVLWTAIYSLGYESIAELIKYLLVMV